jgi:superfamily I DNA and/or RNA helicase
MHPSIAEFCNNFYDDSLINGNKPHQTNDLPPPPADANQFERYVLSTRLGFFPVDNPVKDMDAKVNEAEAELCAKIISTLLKRDACMEDTGARPYGAEEIGVIVPFRNQIANVRALLAQKLGEGQGESILVDTVERFQGSERPVIIFSTVIQSLYLSDLLSARRYDEQDDDGDEDNIEIDRKLNVAVTRAKERFYIVGNERVLRGLHAYGDLLEWISTRTGFCDTEAVF